jgi:endonuclease/exonuclease/phosphatase family metal-dependent hydrolase
MRLAAFNVENLFDRARVFNDDAPPSAHQPVLDAHAELNTLFEKDVYTPADKARMLELIALLGMLRSDEGSADDAPLGGFTRIRRIREQLIRRPRDANLPREIVADGRGDWVGWCELKTEPVDEQAMLNTARVIADLAPDVLAVVEAESRPVLRKFHEMLSARLNIPQHFAHIMVIDGNDDRGIDVGLGTAAGFPIGAVTSQVDRLIPGKTETVYSRDCPDYTVTTPSGAVLHILPNHFKSKFGGNDDTSKDKRLAQANATADIYRALRAAGQDNVVILGDLNDTPDSAELASLLTGTDLKDVSTHPAFTEFQYRADTGGRGIGTFDTGRDSLKIDYILLSPALFASVTLGGIFRKGAWTASDRWDMYPTLTRKVHAASDHHAIWCDISI